MSAEHEKDPSAPLKRPRGGDGGLDGRGGGGGGGPGGPLGSPEKKKRKANSQGASFLLPSEYAPPLNPSVDHLVAANPFDDNYHSASYKPLAFGNPYLASNPSYPAFGGGFNAFRMPPHMLSRTASPYGATYPLRNQPFPQSPVGLAFNRPPAIHFGPQENASFGNQPSYNASVHQNHSFPGQPHFRPNPGENFGHMPSHNTTQMAHHEMPVRFGPGSHPYFSNSPVEANPCYVPLPNHFCQPKPSPKTSASKHKTITTPQRHHLHSPEDTASVGKAEVNTENRHLSANPEGVLPKSADNNLDSGRANGAPNERDSVEGVPAEQGNKTPLHPSQHGNPSSEPMYPCGICTHEVNDDQDAIVCEASCHKWFHRICTGMTESAYGLLTAEASAVWGCDTCMADEDIQLMRTRETVGPQGLDADL